MPIPQLFQNVLLLAMRFIADETKLVRKGDSQACDLLAVGHYMQAAVSSLLHGVRKGGAQSSRELPIIPHGASGRGSTLYVDFCSVKPIYTVEKCHLNAMVADTRKWEQSAAFALDSHAAVESWVKNDHLGFAIPYRKRDIAAKYLPDFVVTLDSGLRVIVEVKGRRDDEADVKAKAAERWVEAVNATAAHGRWAYVLVEDPQRLSRVIDALVTEDGASEARRMSRTRPR